jgi:hypothetical protein
MPNSLDLVKLNRIIADLMKLRENVNAGGKSILRIRQSEKLCRKSLLAMPKPSGRLAKSPAEPL